MDYESVTIEGTLMPAAGVLARGERTTVAYTPRIQRLVRRGFIKVVENHDADDVVEEAPVEEISEEGGTPLVVEPEIEPPRRNAGRDEWAVWLDENEIPYPPEAGRDDLIILWDDVQ